MLDGNTELLEGHDGVSSILLGDIERGEVEIASLVEHLGLGPGVLEVEVLEFRTDEEGVAEVGGALHVALEDETGVALEWSPAGGLDVAEHRCDLGLGPPREDLERGRVGFGDHVGFLPAGVPLDRRTVEGHALAERHVELGGADRHRLEETLDVGEPQANETNAPFFDGPEDILGLLGEAGFSVVR